LVRGQVGTIVESWAPGVYEVEFCDDNGRALRHGHVEGRTFDAAQPRAEPSGSL